VTRDIHIVFGGSRLVVVVVVKEVAVVMYRGADKPLSRPGRKQTRKHVRDSHDFNNIETRAVYQVIFFFFLQGKAPKEICAILTETLACFLRDRAKDLSAFLYLRRRQELWQCGVEWLDDND